MAFKHKIGVSFISILASALAEYIPILEKLPAWMGGGRTLFKEARTMEDAFVKPQLKYHLENYSEDRADEDFIFSYISRMKNKTDAGKDTTLNGLCFGYVWTIF